MPYDFTTLPDTPPRGVTGVYAADLAVRNEKLSKTPRWKLYRSEHAPADAPAYLPAVDATQRDH